MKHDALVSQGIEIVERVPIPDELVPADAQVEIAAKKAAGYYTPEPQQDRDADTGRPLARQVLSARSCPPVKSGDGSRLVVAERRGGARARASDAGDRARGQAAEFPHRSRSPGRRRRSRARDHAQGLSRARRAVPFALAAFRRRRRRSLGRDRPARPNGPIARRARGPRSISPSSACCSMPAPGRRGATAIRRPASAIGRSEGLALASLAMFARRRILVRSARSAARRCRGRLRDLTAPTSRAAFQVTDANPLVGLEGRAELLRRLGAAVAAKPESSASSDTPRPGGLFDRPGGARRRRTAIAAPTILCGAAAASRADLAVAADARRRAARRLLAASGADDRRCDQRPRAAAQAVAMAGLFADRAAAGGRHRR